MTRRWYPGSRGLLLAVSGLPALAGLAAALWVGADIDALRRVLATPGIELSMASALWSGAIATAIALFLAHIAMALAATGGWRRSLNNLALPLLAMPHLAVGIGLVLVLAPSGLLLRLVSPWASGLTLPPDWQTVQDPFGLSLIAGLVIKETCFLLLVLHAALSQVPAERLLQQARSLGYGRIKGWFVAVAPLLQRQIRLPLAAVLVFGMTNVELAIPLGPGLPPTFPVLLWQWFTDPDPQIHAQAYTGTLLLFAMTLFVLGSAAACGAAVRRVSRQWATGGARGVHERGLRYGLSGLLTALWVLGMLAVVAIVLRSASGTWRFPAVLPTGDALAGWAGACTRGAGRRTTNSEARCCYSHCRTAAGFTGRGIGTSQRQCAAADRQPAVPAVAAAANDLPLRRTGAAHTATHRRHIRRRIVESSHFRAALPVEPRRAGPGGDRSPDRRRRTHTGSKPPAHLVPGYGPPACAHRARGVRARVLRQHRAVSADPVRRCRPGCNGRD
ncbi:MAG: hypothetical protein U5K38_16520 [Woeseiaceae bacterium]|nr:hypothetical protein [Woeseiaceae bacterium]